VFFEEGEPMVDGDAGDLKFVVRTAPDARFARQVREWRNWFCHSGTGRAVCAAGAGTAELVLPQWRQQSSLQPLVR
jgi:hypothetical protein